MFSSRWRVNWQGYRLLIRHILRLRTVVGASRILSTPASTPTPAKTVVSDRPAPSVFHRNYLLKMAGLALTSTIEKTIIFLTTFTAGTPTIPTPKPLGFLQLFSPTDGDTIATGIRAVVGWGLQREYRDIIETIPCSAGESCAFRACNPEWWLVS